MVAGIYPKDPRSYLLINEGGTFVDKTQEMAPLISRAGMVNSAVVADLVDVARGRTAPAFGVPSGKLAGLRAAPMERHRGDYYVRLMVLDRPGVIADVAAALRDENVSLESMLQRGRSPDETVPVVLTTHVAEEAGMTRALARIAALKTVREKPRMIRIEEF